MAKIEAILGAARTRTIWRTKANLEKGRQPPEKMSIFGKNSIKELRPSAFHIMIFKKENQNYTSNICKYVSTCVLVNTGQTLNCFSSD